jgi:hypothetical protein
LLGPRGVSYNPGMRRANFDRLVNAFLQRKPWKSFTVELVSGAVLEVNHPESLTHMGDVVVVNSTTGLRSYFDFSDVARFIDGTGVG